MLKEKVLVTGANGFIGQALVSAIQKSGESVAVSCVRTGTVGGNGCRYFDLDSVSAMPALNDIGVVIHTAARVHVMNETAADSLEAFRQANVRATLALALHAKACGVRRFIYLSSIKVNGESTALGRAFQATDCPAPVDAYGISKHEAESALLELAEPGGMDVVIIRPPLVYGPGVKANFLSMMKWVRRGVPLPLGAVGNIRSLVYLENLVDLILVCTNHPSAANKVFLVCDPQPVSTPELLRMIAKALGVRSRVFAVPVRMLEACAALFGKRAVVQRLTGSLQVSIDANRSLLGWTPPFETVDGIQKTVQYFMGQRKE